MVTFDAEVLLTVINKALEVNSLSNLDQWWCVWFGQ